MELWLPGREDMEDSNYTTGLLIASCLLLVVAIVVTYMEISEYREVSVSPPVGVVVPTAAPTIEEEAAEEALETPGEGEGVEPAEEGAEEGEAEGANEAGTGEPLEE